MTEERGRAGMNLRELQTEVHAIAVAKGWWDTERTFGDLIALVQSELSQAFEAHQERGLDGWVEPRVVEKDPPPPSWDRTAFTHDVLNKPCGFASELADVVIRVADMAEHYGVDLQAEDRWDRLSDYRQTMRQQRTFGEWITFCSFYLSHVFNEYTVRSRPWAPYIRRFLKEVQAMADHYGIELEGAVFAKMEYIRGRARC